MSWSVTIEDVQALPDVPADIAKRLAADNPLYEQDFTAALDAAWAAKLVKVTLSGGRTPSPYGGPDTVVITVTGFSDSREPHAVARTFYDEMREVILAGPDEEEDDDDDEQWD